MRSQRKHRIWAVSGEEAQRRRDVLVTEEPLEIQLRAGQAVETAAITMRTPGHDYELAAGFLYGEGIISGRYDFVHMTYCVDDAAQQEYNLLSILLRARRLPALPQLNRHFITNSACGVCGKTMLDDLAARDNAPILPGPQVSPALLYSLPERLREEQALFAQTGGLHAAALFAADGTLVAAREDVGRHNALDKLVGWGLLNGRLPFHDHIVLVSGRASFELLQKSLAAGVSLFCAVSAPSSLAVSVAQRFGITLVGFLRDGRCNIYTHPERVNLSS